MSYINTFKRKLMENTNLSEESSDVITFSIDDDRLDQLLHDFHKRELDYVKVKGDDFYTLPRKEFDRFIDAADSRGFDVDFENSEDSVIDVMSDIDEMSTTAGVPGYQTPYAFGNVSDEDVEMLGYKKVKKVKTEAKESTFKKFSKEMFLNEIGYSQYKKDPIASPKQKINHSINYINRGLKEIEKVVNQNVRLKQEMGVDNGVYWKSSRENLTKISERLLRVSKQLKELAS